MNDLKAKYSQLISLITPMEKVIVAFSGGVDSTLLLKVACDCLGVESVLAVTKISPLIPRYEIETATAMARNIGVSHRMLSVDDLNMDSIAANPPNRCFYCKQHMFSLLAELARKERFNYILEGSNHSDLQDFRPGMEAIRSLDMVKSPLLECKLDKDEIRLLAQYHHLANWDQPAAACLASRIPYGDRLSVEKLRAVDEAETRLRRLGFANVRVRHHGSLARIEVLPEDIRLFLEPGLLPIISQEVKACGFTYVALDIDGYRTGSLNKCLPGMNNGR
ncbi:MAG: ATP-dependent sacrificial sulfur transferase LarE [Syntrophomonadaceae bacterium]|jgi:uncharacterized protein